MVHARRLSALCGLVALCSFGTLGAKAVTFTQSGVLSSDNSIVEIDFSTASTQAYTFFTTSYMGGTNADGTTTSAGGFDPVLTLFTAAGTFVPNGVGGGGMDADFTDTLSAGSYILALTEFPNFTNTDLSGFNPDNAAAIAADCPTAHPTFEDAVTCGSVPAAESALNGNYTVNYTSGAVTATTPEPPSALLLLLPLAGVVALNRRKLASAAPHEL